MNAREEAPEESAHKKTYATRAAVIVHGIGVQQRYSTRNGLAQSLRAHSGAGPARLLDPDVPLKLAEPLPQQPLQIEAHGVRLDVYEVYWAPFTSHKTTARSVLNWMLTTTFIPAPKIKKPSHKTGFDIVQGIVYGLLLLLLGLELVMMVGNTTTVAAAHVGDGLRAPGEWGNLSQMTMVLGAIRDSVRITGVSLSTLSAQHIGQVLGSMQFLVWVALAILVWLTAQLFYRVTQLRLGSVGRQVGFCVVLLLLIFLCIQLVAPVLAAFALIVAAGGWIARRVAFFLAESLGDVQVYANGDENGAHYAAREAVIDEAEKAFQLIKQRAYAEVVVFGHSLGAVVAFDVLDGLRLKDPDLLKRVRVFVTFGSALEKVRYFFDRKASAEVPPDPAASLGERLSKHAEIDLRRREAVRQAFDGVARGRAWLNLWYWNDMVADPIASFTQASAPVGPSPVAAARGIPADPSDMGVNNLLADAKNRSCLNLSGWTWTPWPLSHSHYLRSTRIEKLFAVIAFQTKLP